MAPMVATTQMRRLTLIVLVALVARPTQAHAAAQIDDKSAVETTVRAMEQAVQDYDFARQDSLLMPDARWIERSLPERAAFDGTGFFAKAKAAKVLLTNHPHHFDIRIQGSVAWVTLLVDVTTISNNEAARALLARTEFEETGKSSPSDQREWRAT